MIHAWLRPKRSLAGRLALAITGAVTAALVLAAGLSVWREVARYADARHDALEAVAQVFAQGGARATAENDANAAAASLRAIDQVRLAIVYGAIKRLDGSILAEQGIGLRLTRDVALDNEDLSLSSMLSTHTLQAEAPVRDNGRIIGRVVLIGETEGLLAQIWTAGQNAALAALLAIVIGIGVSFYLQRSVTRPLAALAQTMDAVRLRHDYAQRVPVVSDDEVGTLARTLNDLLSAVNERDHRLAAHSAHLETEVQARTADLSDAKHAAETANAAKSVFLATMSHEIRTPMNGVLVMAELLAGSDLPAQQRRYADVIARSGKSLLAILNDILDFAKVEAGKLELERVAVNPADIADTVITLFAERAREAGLDLAASVAPEVPRTIVGDPIRLGQVVSNFVSNALKFTEAGHVSVRMTIDPKDGSLIIAVTDTGIGIPQDKLATIFSAFSQADQSTTRRFGGTGLGLSIAERLIAAMGGKVAVVSRIGEGSTFSARIPVEVLEPSRSVTRLAGVPIQVVLHTDRPATREVLAADLRAAGFEPSDTADGACALCILDAASLVALGCRPAGAERVLAIGTVGEGSAEQAQRGGLADDILRWPVLQADWQPMLAAFSAGHAFAACGERKRQVDLLPRFPHARVLVADDSAVNREVAREALARCGVSEIVTVEDGAAAVAQAAAKSFDLILMDGSMPVLDGFGAARAIRQRESVAGEARTPIIALTAHVLGDTEIAAEAAGMDGMLSKPFTLRQLAEVLERQVPAKREEATEGGGQNTIRTRAVDPGDLIDKEVLDGLLSFGDGEFLDRILNLYRRQAPAALSSLQTALLTSNQASIARTAHSLKSMSANIGAKALVERLGLIEKAARDDAYICSSSDYNVLQGMLEGTLSRLDHWLITYRPAA